ncbi:bdp1 [Ecytonucleospora hepatopenaei]|uniref:Bdp1 n=1 Tax=Ecytonucleospora hepatopenaei TaxID=646526 RepID=A0A1W0E918_9MICR|nr:bdp1 [Ecytonucleospora hepatopenaei]
MSSYSRKNKNEPNSLQFFCDNKNFKESKLLTRETQDLVTTGTYLKKKSLHKKWNEEETKKFYKALSLCGCDFSLMEMLFKTRKRKCLKEKYIKELKNNKNKVESALRKHKKMDKSKLKEILEM